MGSSCNVPIKLKQPTSSTPDDIFVPIKKNTFFCIYLYLYIFLDFKMDGAVSLDECKRKKRAVQKVFLVFIVKRRIDYIIFFT